MRSALGTLRFGRPNPHYSPRISAHPNFIFDGGLRLYLPFWDATDQGYALSYDGNDVISNATANFRNADSTGAIEVWFRSSSVANKQTLFASSDVGTTTSYISFFIQQTTGLLGVDQQNANDTLCTVVGATNVCDGKWHHAVLSSSGTAWTIILDGVAESLSVSAGANDGDWFADTTLRDNLTIGGRTATSTISYLIGVHGFTRIYSREMLVAEARTNYQRGRKATASDATGLVFNLPCTEGTGNPVDTVGSLTMTSTGATWIESLMDKSPNASPASAFGIPTWGSQGRTFNGSAYVNVGSPVADLQVGSVGVWIKATSWIGQNRGILQLGSGTHLGVWVSQWSSTLYVGAANGYEAGFEASISTTAWDTNSWYHIFGTFVALGKPQLYVNGVYVSEAPNPNTLGIAATTPWWVGRSWLGYFLGSIGEIVIYNRILTADEIFRLYQATRWRYGV